MAKEETKPDQTDGEYIAPATPIEKSLVDMEQNLFCRNQIGITDDFFVLGGNSLKAIRLISLVYAEYGIELQLSDIFEARTIRALSRLIENHDQGETGIPQLEKAENKGSYHLPCAVHISSVEGDFFQETYFNLGRMDIIIGKLDVSALEKAFQTMIARHDAFRTSFHYIDGSYWFKVADAVPFKLDYEQCTEDDARKKITDFIRIFDVGTAPLIRASVIQVAEEKYYFLLDMHHNIYDAESIGIFDREIWQIYRGESLDQLPFQYKDYQVWLDTLCSGEIPEKHKAYWMRKLQGFRIAGIPADQMIADTNESKRECFLIDASGYQAIDKLCGEWQITRPCFIISGFMLLLAIESGQHDITLGLRISNRFDPRLDGVIGSFLEQAVVRAQFTNEETIEVFFDSVNTTIAEAVEHSIYPYKLLKEEIGKMNSSGYTEFFSIMVNYIDDEGSEYFMCDGLYREKSLIVKPDHTPFDINFKIIDNHKELKMDFKYIAGLFSREKICRLISGYKKLINEILNSKNRAIKDVIRRVKSCP